MPRPANWTRQSDVGLFSDVVADATCCGADQAESVAKMAGQEMEQVRANLLAEPVLSLTLRVERDSRYRKSLPESSKTTPATAKSINH